MTKVKQPSTNINSGAIFFDKEEKSSGTYSDVYLFPALELYAIAASIGVSDDGDLEVTADPDEEIEADTALFVAWNGSAPFNLGLTGWRVKRNSGTVTVKVTVKTAEA
jgi:hypothetical protein